MRIFSGLLLGTAVLFCELVAIEPLSEFTLDEYIEQMGDFVSEGHSCAGGTAQPEYLTQLIKRSPSVVMIAEIGFNGGHSSELFLKARSNTKVVSFDIMRHGYATLGKEYMDIKYPGRHQLVMGNSLETIPEYTSSHPGQIFDLIFVDGGHSYDVALNDILNARALANRKTVLIVDDLNKPTVYKAWKKCVDDGVITRGKVTQSKHKRWSKCRYIFN